MLVVSYAQPNCCYSSVLPFLSNVILVLAQTWAFLAADRACICRELRTEVFEVVMQVEWSLFFCGPLQSCSFLVYLLMIVNV